jgi:hypothetical protein
MVMQSKRMMRVLIISLALGAGLATHALAEDKKPAAPTMESAVTKTGNTLAKENLLTLTATVQDVNLARREVTLKGSEGRVETFMVSPKVERITEIGKGDEVTIQYYLGIAAELRPPTEEEKKEPYKEMEQDARAPKTSAPAGMEVRTIRVVATVEAIDTAAKTVTLKGPKGRTHTVAVEDPAVLQKAKKGDTVIVTAAEAFAVSLEKVAKGKAK